MSGICGENIDSDKHTQMRMPNQMGRHRRRLEGSMHFNYNKLWKLLIDRGMKKKELKEAANVSSASLAKLAKGENIQTDVLLRICEALDVELNDIVDTVRD